MTILASATSINTDDHKLPLAMFIEQVYNKPDAIFLRQPLSSQWRQWSWRDAHFEIVRVASYLQKFPRGSTIAIYSHNCAHWILADLAIWLAGHVSVPIYPSAGVANIEQILRHSGCVAVFVGKLADFSEKRAAIPVTIEMLSMHTAHPELWSWDEIVARELPLMNAKPRMPDELATIIYTSGTTGEPKGVMISFAAMASAASNAVEWTGVGDYERFFSYLPLAHVAERLVIEMGALYCGGSIAFAESLESFARNLRSAGPTIFLGVPRIWLKFQQGFVQRFAQHRLNTCLRIPLLSYLVKALVRRALGLQHVRLALSGASPLSSELIAWFEAIGVPICEGYGMTENFGYSHFSHPLRRRAGYVGECLPNAKLRLAEDGEVLMQGPSMMLGYYQQPELSRLALQDGWLHSGDLGALDELGRLCITGRKKDLFKTSKGKYVAPGPIETRLEMLAGVEQLVVLGVGLAQPVAVAVVSAVNALDSDEKQKLSARLNAALQQINTDLETHEKLDALFVSGERWTTDNGLLTPSLKARRFEIEQRYTSAIHALLPGLAANDDHNAVLYLE